MRPGTPHVRAPRQHLASGPRHTVARRKTHKEQAEQLAAAPASENAAGSGGVVALLPPASRARRHRESAPSKPLPATAVGNRKHGTGVQKSYWRALDNRRPNAKHPLPLAMAYRAAGTAIPLANRGRVA